MSDVSWMALALALTVCGGLWTIHAWRNRGVASALRGVALTLLPGAAFLTGTLEMFGEVASAIADWGVGFVFSPLVWLGIAMFVLAIALFGAAARVPARRRGRNESGRNDSGKNASDTPDRRDLGAREPGKLPGASAKGAPAIDDDLSDIEAILRKRGIS